MTDTHIELIDWQGRLVQHLRLRGMTGSPQSIQLGATWYDPAEEQLEEWGRRLIYQQRPHVATRMEVLNLATGDGGVSTPTDTGAKR